MRVGRSVLRVSFALMVPAILAGTGGVPAGAAGRLRAVPRNLNISRERGNQSETTIAINLVNPLQMTVASDNPDGTLNELDIYTARVRIR